MVDDRVTSNFRRKEFACPCGCGFDAVDVELLIALQTIRDKLGTPLSITKNGAACRCREYNEKIGGAEKSMHLHAKAADIYVHKMQSSELYAIVDSLFPDTYGIGVYDWHVHIDVRPVKVRWNEKSK